MEKVCENKTVCKVGGQAVMEGVMMKSEKGIALAVRKPDGEIVSEYKPFESKAKKGTFAGFPIIRGVVVFVESLTTGMRTLTTSANIYSDGVFEDEEPSKFEKFLADKLGKSVESIVIGLAVVLAILLSLGLFFALPLLVGNLIFGGDKMIWRSLVEGGVRLVVFLGYLMLCSQLKDIKRVFMYHGAEHKTIACYEAGDPLTPEYAMKHKRLHPRCGTNYMFLVMAISILFFTAVDIAISTLTSFNPEGVLGYLFRLGTRLLFIPIVAGLSYEVLQLAAKSDGWLARVIRAPGMGLQLITTREPSPDMIEVALASFKLAMHSIGEEVEIPGDNSSEAPVQPEETEPSPEENAAASEN